MCFYRPDLTSALLLAGSGTPTAQRLLPRNVLIQQNEKMEAGGSVSADKHTHSDRSEGTTELNYFCVSLCNVLQENSKLYSFRGSEGVCSFPLAFIVKSHWKCFLQFISHD